VISRRHALSEDYRNRLMRDVSAIEIATTAHDVEMVRPMFVVAGFAVVQTPSRLVARVARYLH
jgi:hypothetical protein